MLGEAAVFAALRGPDKVPSGFVFHATAGRGGQQHEGAAKYSEGAVRNDELIRECAAEENFYFSDRAG